MAIDGTVLPWAATKDYIYSAAGFLRLTHGFSVTGTTITSGGLSKIDFTGVLSNKPNYAGAVSTEQKYYESKTDTGVTLRIPNNALTVNAQSGYVTSSDTGNQEKFEVTLYTGFTNYQTLLGLYRAGSLVIASRGIGLKADTGLNVGYEHLMGKITEFTAEPKEGLMEIKIVITGGTLYVASTGATYAEFNACSTGSGNKVQPDGVADVEYTILALSESTAGTSYATLLTGVILQTAAS